MVCISTLLHHILWMVFQEKYFSCYILSTDKFHCLIAITSWYIEQCVYCIAIVCFPVCDAISFEINLIFLIKPFFYMTKKSRQKFKYLQNEKSFQGEIKSILVAENCLRPDSAL